MTPETLTRLTHMTDGGDTEACCELLRYYSRAGDVEKVNEVGLRWLCLPETPGRVGDRRQVGYIMATANNAGLDITGPLNSVEWPPTWTPGAIADAKINLVEPSFAQMETVLRAALSRCIRLVMSSPVGRLLVRACEDYEDLGQRALVRGFARARKLVNDPNALRLGNTDDRVTMGVIILTNTRPSRPTVNGVDYDTRAHMMAELRDFVRDISRVVDMWFAWVVEAQVGPLSIRGDVLYINETPEWQTRMNAYHHCLIKSLRLLRDAMGTIGSMIVESRPDWNSGDRVECIKGSFPREQAARVEAIIEAERLAQCADLRSILFGCGGVVVEPVIHTLTSGDIMMPSMGSTVDNNIDGAEIQEQT